MCRMVCGLTRLAANDGIDLLARSAYVVTTRCIPKRVSAADSRAVPEDRRPGLVPIAHKPGQRRYCCRPQRAGPELVPFAMEAHLRVSRPTGDFQQSISPTSISPRAVLLYRKSNRAWSRAPRLVRRSAGWQQGVHLGLLEISRIAVLAVFLNGTARTSAHQAKWTGETRYR